MARILSMCRTDLQIPPHRWQDSYRSYSTIKVDDGTATKEKKRQDGESTTENRNVLVQASLQGSNCVTYIYMQGWHAGLCAVNPPLPFRRPSSVGPGYHLVLLNIIS